MKGPHTTFLQDAELYDILGLRQQDLAALCIRDMPPWVPVPLFSKKKLQFRGLALEAALDDLARPFNWYPGSLCQKTSTTTWMELHGFLTEAALECPMLCPEARLWRPFGVISRQVPADAATPLGFEATAARTEERLGELTLLDGLARAEGRPSGESILKPIRFRRVQNKYG